VDTALIGVSARRQAGDRVGAARGDGAGIEGTPAALFKASIMGDSMVGRGRIIPPDGATGGHGDSSRHVVWRTTVHHDLGCRLGGGGRPSRQDTCKTEYEETPFHRVDPVPVLVSIIHRDRFNAEGFIGRRGRCGSREKTP